VSGFNTTNFTVSSDGGTTNHPGTVSISDKVVTFTPSINFNSNATYKVTLKAGSSLSTDYSFTFSTGNLSDTTPPSISSTNPLTGDTNMPINITISATLSETVDPNTVNSSTMIVSGGVSGTVVLSDQTISFKPNTNLPVNTTLAVTIKSGIKDLAGNTMSSQYSWTFTTGSTVATNCVFDTSTFDSCLYE
ncbi:MAG TPA: Ig-like domain-containing protein, partial [Leptospiraceae bacterium]|nr:Ig-like domain-containing protein [Leptospiraceae bacterium]